MIISKWIRGYILEHRNFGTGIRNTLIGVNTVINITGYHSVFRMRLDPFGES